MKRSVYLRLAVMMFGQYLIWGAWYVTLGTYLTKIGFQGSAIGQAYSTIAWAAVISAFFMSMVADRYFAAEKLTGWLHLGGGGLMYLASTITTPGPFFWVLMAYAILYAPTLALTAAIGMRHCTETGRDYPRIRVLGTLGWIVAGLANSALGIEFGPQPMWIAAAVSIALGLFCFTLPATPPQARAGRGSISGALGLPALKLMRNRPFAVLGVSALFITLPFAMYHPVTNMYLNEIGVTGVAAKMTLAQAAELVFMLLIPFFLLRLGIKWMLLVGMIAWVVRFGFLAAGNAGDRMYLLYAGILLHGVCYDFFYVTAQIYMDRKAPPELRTSVQGFFTLLTFGVGWLLGSYLTGAVLQRYQITDAHNLVIGHHWQSILIIPAGIALVVAVAFAIAFKDDSAKPVSASPPG